MRLNEHIEIYMQILFAAACTVGVVALSYVIFSWIWQDWKKENEKEELRGKKYNENKEQQ